ASAPGRNTRALPPRLCAGLNVTHLITSPRETSREARVSCGRRCLRRRRRGSQRLGRTAHILTPFFHEALAIAPLAYFVFEMGVQDLSWLQWRCNRKT